MTFTLDTINEAAGLFWKLAGDKKVFAVHGEMGAGKTTFIHALCTVKGVTSAVTSPTFSLINEYEYSCEGTPRVIFHMDLYRIKSKDEAIQAGIEDCLYGGNICLVEWPEKAPELFPEETTHVYITIIDSSTRKISINHD